MPPVARRRTFGARRVHTISMPLQRLRLSANHVYAAGFGVGAVCRGTDCDKRGMCPSHVDPDLFVPIRPDTSQTTAAYTRCQRRFGRIVAGVVACDPYTASPGTAAHPNFDDGGWNNTHSMLLLNLALGPIPEAANACLR